MKNQIKNECWSLFETNTLIYVDGGAGPPKKLTARITYAHYPDGIHGTEYGAYVTAFAECPCY